MRLTLRTLLAYLDDVLDPTNSKEIGQKIQESQVALKTIERIREVTRRRRINSPDVDDAKIEPNSVAEYLDNTLDPQKVASIEQICLDDDEYLAEVAACHQILTLVLGEPVDITSNTRDRMYQLENHVSMSMQEIASNTNVAQSPQKMSENLVSPVTKIPEKQVPDYLKKDSFLQRYWPITLMLALGAGWLYVFLTDDTFKKSNQEVALNSISPLNSVDKQINTPKVPSAGENNTSGAVSSGISSVGQNAETNTKESIASITQPVMEAPTTKITDAPLPPNQEMPSTNLPQMVNTPPDKPSSVTPVTEIPLPIPPLFYRFNEDLLISQQILGDDWYVVENDQQIMNNELLACPKPFRTTLEFLESKVKIELDGGSVVQFLSPTKDRDFGLEIKRGRVVISREDESIKSPLNLELIVGNHTWPINIGPGKLLIGFDVIPRLPEHFEETFELKTHQVNMKTELGKTTIKLEDLTTQILDTPQEITLVKLDKIIPLLREMTQPSFVALQNNDWLKESDQLKTNVRKKQAKDFLKQIDAGPVDAPLPVWLSITPLITDANVKNAEFATQTLALKSFKRGDHAVELIMCMARTPHEEAMKSAIDGLREWLPNHPDNRISIKEDLVKIFPEDTSAAIYQLLWGYNAEDLRNLDTSLKLIDWLLHNDDCVRQLAFYHIERITGFKNNYHPLEAPGRREATVRRWRLQVEQDGGLVH